MSTSKRQWFGMTLDQSATSSFVYFSCCWARACQNLAWISLSIQLVSAYSGHQLRCCTEFLCLWAEGGEGGNLAAGARLLMLNACFRHSLPVPGSFQPYFFKHMLKMNASKTFQCVHLCGRRECNCSFRGALFLQVFPMNSPPWTVSLNFPAQLRMFWAARVV